MEEENKSESMIRKVEHETEKVINTIIDDGIHSDNVDMLGKVIDIHKDVANEKYWKEKEEYYMRYGNYDRGSYGRHRDDYDIYGRGRARDSRGRFKESGRGGRYRGHDIIDDMSDNYGRYVEGQEEYNRGNYGAKEDTIKSLEYMMESVVCFIEMLEEDATSEEEMNVIRKYARKISEM